MKNKALLSRVGAVAAATLLAGGAGLAGAEQASANSYGSMDTNQLMQLCESHGSRYWTMPDGSGSIEISTEQVQYGSTGDCVAYAQRLLVNVTYSISVDGDFGS